MIGDAYEDVIQETTQQLSVGAVNVSCWTSAEASVYYRCCVPTQGRRPGVDGPMMDRAAFI